MDVLATLEFEHCLFVMDNASFHHLSRFEDTLAQRGPTIYYLTPLTPSVKPIEYFFHQWKVDVRSQHCTNKQDMPNALAGAVLIAPPEICKNLNNLKSSGVE
jgi:transposase